MDPLDEPEEQPGAGSPAGPAVPPRDATPGGPPPDGAAPLDGRPLDGAPLDAPRRGGHARRWAMTGAGLLTVIVLVVLALALGGGSDDGGGEAGDPRSTSGSTAPSSDPLGRTRETTAEDGSLDAPVATAEEPAGTGLPVASSTTASASSTTSAMPTTTAGATSVPASAVPTPAGTEVASQGPSPSYPGAPASPAAPPAPAPPPTTAGVPSTVEATDPPPEPPPPDPEGIEPPDGEDPPLDDSTEPNPPQPVGAAIDCFAWSGPAPEPLPPIGDPLEDALASMIGRWSGTATAPEGSPPIGDVWFEFYPYGSYTSSCNGPVSVAALGSGGNCACSTNQLRPLAVHDGGFDAEIDVSWPVNGTDWIAGSTAMTGQLRNVVVTGDLMTFSFVATWDGEVAPITYQLQRVA